MLEDRRWVVEFGWCKGKRGRVCMERDRGTGRVRSTAHRRVGVAPGRTVGR
jgi:hypothetical protein